MLSFGRVSLKKKITLLILATSCVVLLLSSSIFVGSQIVTYKRLTVGELNAAASIIANTVTAAIVFDDPESAEETLSALRARPSILTAKIFQIDGSMFAEYHAKRPRNNPDETREPISAGDPNSLFKEVTDYQFEFLDGYADLHAPVRLDGEIIAVLFIRSDLTEMYDIINTYRILAGIVILSLILVAFLIASRLQRIVTRPVMALLKTIQNVARDHDYSLRAKKHGTDELGDLTDGFNQMLETIQHHDDRMRDARREAEAASRAKTEFLANMSHELRTPLNAIIGFSEIMKGELLGSIGDDRYRIYAQDIFNSGQHLLEVINDILDISKVEAGDIELHEDATDLPDLVSISIRLVRERAETAGVELVVDLAPDAPQLFVDPRLIKQCLINLLDNAIKFTPGPGRVTVRAAQTSDGSVLLSVTDTGIGIEEEQIPRILQPFGQVEGALSRNYEGTGLGLPLTKSFIEAHDGSVEIESVLGVGTTATLRFPPERVIHDQRGILTSPAAG